MGDIPHTLVEIVTNAVSAFLLIILIYILQHILDMHFECSCVAGLHLNGWLYLVAPSFIFTFVVQILELLRLKSEGFSIWHCLVCNCPNNQLCSHILKFVLKLVSMSAMWITVVLFDGDWYYCLKTNYNASQTGLPCKTNLTMEERRIKNGYRTESLDYGFFVLFGFLLLWNLIEMVKSYCPLKNLKTFDCTTPYYNVVYETYLAKEVTNYLHSELKEIAKEKAKALCGPHIENIRKHELTQSHTHDGNSTQRMDTVPETWSKISKCDFFLKEVTDSQMSSPTSPTTGLPASDSNSPKSVPSSPTSHPSHPTSPLSHQTSPLSPPASNPSPLTDSPSHPTSQPVPPESPSSPTARSASSTQTSHSSLPVHSQTDILELFDPLWVPPCNKT